MVIHLELGANDFYTSSPADVTVTSSRASLKSRLV